eukprot:jgi/Psemu1/49234/gm1.49234_g
MRIAAAVDTTRIAAAADTTRTTDDSTRSRAATSANHASTHHILGLTSRKPRTATSHRLVVKNWLATIVVLVSLLVTTILASSITPAMNSRMARGSPFQQPWFKLFHPERASNKAAPAPRTQSNAQEDLWSRTWSSADATATSAAATATAAATTTTTTNQCWSVAVRNSSLSNPYNKKKNPPPPSGPTPAGHT